jgi:hypothetical protein
MNTSPETAWCNPFLLGEIEGGRDFEGAECCDILLGLDDCRNSRIADKGSRMIVWMKALIFLVRETAILFFGFALAVFIAAFLSSWMNAYLNGFFDGARSFQDLVWAFLSQPKSGIIISLVLVSFVSLVLGLPMTISKFKQVRGRINDKGSSWAQYFKLSKDEREESGL